MAQGWPETRCRYNCRFNLTRIVPRQLKLDSEGWWTFTFVRDPVERMLAGISTIAGSGPLAPKLQLWPSLNMTLRQARGLSFRPDAEMVTSALERLLSNQRLRARRRYNVHTAPQVL